MTADLKDGLDTRNARIKLVDAAPSDVADGALLESLAQQDGGQAAWSKLLVYARDNASGAPRWTHAGLKREATIEGFFEDRTDAAIWSLFTDPDRAAETMRDEHETALRLAQSKPPLPARELDAVPPGFTMRRATPDDAGRIAALMKESLSIFRLVESERGMLVAVASAEIDHSRKNAELTDCTTHPEFRGRGLNKCLLSALHGDLVEDWGIYHVYSIARALETGMNCVFRQLGYHYTGRLVANSRMPEGWESMNIWCRTL